MQPGQLMQEKVHVYCRLSAVHMFFFLHELIKLQDHFISRLAAGILSGRSYYRNSVIRQGFFQNEPKYLDLLCMMAQMAHFSFPYYFTIPNSEICTTNFGIQNCEVYIIWASGYS